MTQSPQPLRPMRPLRAELLTPFEHYLLGSTPKASPKKPAEMHTLEAVILKDLSPREAAAMRDQYDCIRSEMIGRALGLGGPLLMRLFPADPATGITERDPEVGIWDEEKQVLVTEIDGRNIRLKLVSALSKNGKEVFLRSEVKQEGSKKNPERE